jgi:hypothetical protein
MFNSATGNGAHPRPGSTINVEQDAELYSNTAARASGQRRRRLPTTRSMGDKALISTTPPTMTAAACMRPMTSLFDMDLAGHPCSGRGVVNYYNTPISMRGGVYARDSSEVDLRQVL